MDKFNRYWLFVTSCLLVLLIIPLTGLAYSDPTGPPPTDNTMPPLNVGTEAQNKAGDLEVGNFKANSGVELGGVFRSSWAEAGGSCAWEGTRCSCGWDDSSIGFVTVTLGITCEGGVVTDFGIKGFNFSSREDVCPTEAPVECNAGYHALGIDEPPGSAVMRTLEAGVAVFNNYVVRTVRGIGNLLRDWF